MVKDNVVKSEMAQIVIGICAVGFGLKAIKGRSDRLKLSFDDSANVEMSSPQPSELDVLPEDMKQASAKQE